jgi:hypothetical protein
MVRDWWRRDVDEVERERVKFGKTKKLDQSEKNKSINIAFDGKVAKGVCNIRRTV